MKRFDGALTFDPDSAIDTTPLAEGLFLGAVQGTISIPGLTLLSFLDSLAWTNGPQDTFSASQIDFLVMAQDVDGSTFGTALPPRRWLG